MRKERAPKAARFLKSAPAPVNRAAVQPAAKTAVSAHSGYVIGFQRFIYGRNRGFSATRPLSRPRAVAFSATIYKEYLHPMAASPSHAGTIPTAAVVLAAGMGTRMRSALPKVMHAIGGRPMVNHVLATLAE